MKPLRPEDPERLGPYRLVARLGAGGMGRVYLAVSDAGRTVAVKIIRPEMAEDKNFRIRFRREVAAAAAVGGIYTAPVVDAAPDAETPWLATDYIPGPTLAEAIADHGPLPVDTVLALGAGIAEALVAVHAEGLVHRDLKPTNVLLAADGPRVIDFGIVRARDGYELTGTGGLFGSLEYMCPEQATGERMGPEGDVFCLGSVLAFASCGRAPFSGAAAATLLYQVVHGSPDLSLVPDPLDRIIGLCLAKDPVLRISPDRLSAACAPGGAEQMLKDGWLPASLTALIDTRRAAAADLDLLARTPAFTSQWADTPGPRTGPDSVPSGAGSRGSVYATVGPSPVHDRTAGGTGRHCVRRGRGTGGAGGARPVLGTSLTVESPERAPEPSTAALPAPALEPPVSRPLDPTDTDTPTDPHHPRTSAHRRTPDPRPGVSRRVILSAAVGTALVGGVALAVTRQTPEARGARGLAPAPEPSWTYRGDPLLQTPAAFNSGAALLKSRPGNMVALDLADGSRPRWVYRGISLSPTPVVLTYGAAIALGTGATLIGVDPADGSERFTLDFGEEYRFDQLLGRYNDYAVSVLGARLQRQSSEEGVATTTSTVFRIDLKLRQAIVTPIDQTDAGIEVKPVITSDYFVYADGLRNVTVRNNAGGGSLRWRHPVGYDLRPGVAVLDQSVFAIGSELIALDLPTGKLRWRAKAERGQFASLGTGGNTVYATGTDPDGVYAYNASNGKRRWFCETPKLNLENPIAVGVNAVYIPAFENKKGFYAIDAASGRLLWNFTDGRETGVNNWQLSCDGAGHLVAQHYDRTYGLPAV